MSMLVKLLVFMAALPVAPAMAQQFEPRPGLEALASSATGVFEIGAVDIGPVEAVLRALVHNGQILQIHSRRADEWLAKRSGSAGGKSIAPTTLDELTHIAGGLDTNVRCESSIVRAEFARAADVVLLAGASDCRVAPAARRIDCNAISCSVSYRNAAQPTGFRIKVDPERATWFFEGYGIVAIWALPEG